MALSGIPQIDELLAGSGSAAIGPGDPDRDSVGLVQDLLAGQGQRGLPNLLSPNYGVFGPLTTTAVRSFRTHAGLPAADQVDAQTLQQMVQTPASAPMASRGYLTLALDFPFGGLTKILSIVAQMEGAGKFGALNLNTDRAGLSFGLIQWAQKPGRLAEILQAFLASSSNEFVQTFGAGDSDLANRLLAHTRKPNGGVDQKTGETTDPAFDLIEEPWVSRFRQAVLWKPFQQVQVQTAVKDFGNSLGLIRQFAPELTSERAVAFTIDLANQFGNSGARSIFQAVKQSGMSETDLLAAMADESVARIQDSWKAGTQARRQHFLTTSFLSDKSFDNPQGSLPATG